MSEHIELAKAAMLVLGPALPALTGTVKDAVGELAKATWNTIRPWLIEDVDLGDAAKGVTKAPDSKPRQAVFEEELAKHLEKSPAHAAVLGAELEKGKVVQRVVAKDGSAIWQVALHAEGGGNVEQTAE